jgi:hypothetical protein
MVINTNLSLSLNWQIFATFLPILKSGKNLATFLPLFATFLSFKK